MERDIGGLRPVGYKPVMNALRLFRPVVAALVALQPALAQGNARCLTPAEKTAFEMRVLQTELMVATLTCRGVGNRDFSAQYNSFVESHRDALKSHATVFREHFKRSFGGKGEAQLDRYVTSLANDLSRASMMGTGTFCPQQDMLFERAAQVAPKDLRGFAAERAASHPLNIPDCGAARTAAQKPSK